jgi:predicted nucleic acid-binding protein
MKSPCLDSSAWIEITHDGPNVHTFLKAITDPSAVIVPTITLYEVRKYTLLNADLTRAEQISQFMQQGVLVPLNADLAIQAAHLSVERKIPMADSLIYTTATHMNAILWTQDTHFDGLPHVKYFPKSKS